MRRFDFVVSFVCCALLGYFAWHAFKGPRGYPYQTGLEQKMAMLAEKFGVLQQKRIRLEHKVGLLRPESIDADLLDELARGSLDMALSKDIIAYTTR